MDRLPPGSPVTAPTTSWSLILTAQGSAGGGEAALNQLCRLYWQPLYVFARRRGLSAADAEEATQDFFARILAEDWLARVDRSKGRFRGFLFQSMTFHLSELGRHQRAQKRGGNIEHVPLEVESAEQRHLRAGGTARDPAASFDHVWACTVLDHALTQLASEENAAGRKERFDALRPHLVQPPSAGDYERLAAQLGLARPSVAVLVHRLGKR
jgi:DNA-directed RNA polymerase specialized sigma24 family protein